MVLRGVAAFCLFLATSCSNCIECPPPSGYELHGSDCSVGRRVEALACPQPPAEACVPVAGDESTCASHEDCGDGACVAGPIGCACRAATCATDGDCADGFACACGGFLELLPRNTCVPADCRTGADCDSGECVLAPSEESNCCNTGQHRFVCNDDAASCRSNDECPINQKCGTNEDGEPLRCNEFYCLCVDF
jgi:hypothetical protein